MAKAEQLRDFVSIGGKVAVIIANSQSGGVLRGHCDVWFGDLKPNGEPNVQQLPVTDDWKLIGNHGRFVGELQGSLKPPA
jgi:hypothetical protein